MCGWEVSVIKCEAKITQERSFRRNRAQIGCTRENFGISWKKEKFSHCNNRAGKNGCRPNRFLDLG